jgi:hypothetical protein
MHSVLCIHHLAINLFLVTDKHTGAFEVTMAINLTKASSDAELEEAERVAESELTALTSLLAVTGNSASSSGAGVPHGKGMRHSVSVGRSGSGSATPAASFGTPLGSPMHQHRQGNFGAGTPHHHRVGSVGAQLEADRGVNWKGNVDPAVAAAMFERFTREKKDHSRNNARWATHQLFSKLETKRYCCVIIVKGCMYFLIMLCCTLPAPVPV